MGQLGEGPKLSKCLKEEHAQLQLEFQKKTGKKKNATFTYLTVTVMQPCNCSLLGTVVSQFLVLIDICPLPSIVHLSKYWNDRLARVSNYVRT